MVAEIIQYKEQIVELCRCYRVDRLDVFGSAVTNEFHPETSDLDFVVEFADAGQPGYSRRYLDFAESLENLFQRRVDLLTERSISNPVFRAEINGSRVTIYENPVEKVVA